MKTKTAVVKAEKKPKAEPKVNELVIYKQKVEGMKALVEKTIVKDKETAGQVAGIVANIKLLAKKIEDKRDKTKIPAQAIVKEANATYNPMIEACEQAERTLKGKYQAWFLAEEKKQQEEELKIAKKVESGYIKAETAVDKLENLKPVEKTAKSDNGSSLSVKKVDIAVIVSPEKQKEMLKSVVTLGLTLLTGKNKQLAEMLIPADYWVIDEVAAKKASLARYKAGIPALPGTVIEQRIDTSSK